MNLKTKKNGTTLNVIVSGRVDTATAPELEAEVKPQLDGVTSLILDFKDVN